MKNSIYKQTEIGEIPEGWNVDSLGSIAVFQNGRSSPARDIQSDYPVYGANGIIGYTDQTNANAGTVVIGRVGAYCGSLYYSQSPCWVTDNAIKGTPKSTIDAKYLFYLLGTLNLNLRSGGSGQPLINQEILNSININVPPYQEQQQVASILSSLDDKIELNRRMNKTLEEIGKALFKHWFVDFEFPDESGKPYKSSGGEMADSESGRIPKSWETGCLPDVVKIQKGLSYSGKDLVGEGNCALVGLKCFERHGGFRVDGVKYYKGEYKEDHLLETGDLMVAMTDLTQGAEVIGNPVLLPFIPNVDKTVASLDVSIIKPTSYLRREYLYLLLMRQEAQDFLYGYTNGSTVLHLSIKGLYEFKLLIPPQSLVNKFNVLVENIFFLIRKNQHENIILTALKNSLLPRLMSGKLRVKS